MRVACGRGVEEKARVGVVKDSLMSDGRKVALGAGIGARNIDDIKRCRSIDVAMVV